MQMTIDITPEAVEQLARLDDDCEIGHLQCLRFAPTLRALSAALAASQAETAAAYEAAAQYLENPTHQGIRPAWGMVPVGPCFRNHPIKRGLAVGGC
jgi:hypothetical protein